MTGTWETSTGKMRSWYRVSQNEVLTYIFVLHMCEFFFFKWFDKCMHFCMVLGVNMFQCTYLIGYTCLCTLLSFYMCNTRAFIGSWENVHYNMYTCAWGYECLSKISVCLCSLSACGNVSDTPAYATVVQRWSCCHSNRWDYGFKKTAL